MLVEERANQEGDEEEEDHGHQVGCERCVLTVLVLALHSNGSRVTVLVVLLYAVHVDRQTRTVQNDQVDKEYGAQLEQTERRRFTVPNQQMAGITNEYLEGNLEGTEHENTLNQVHQQLTRENQREQLVGSPKNG